MSTTLALSSVEAGLERYLAEVHQHPLLSRAEELELARQFRHGGDVSAAHRLVVANLRFVVKIAYEYRAYGLRLLDIIQEGNVGLMQAVKRFEPERGYRLISYAVWWIRASIRDYILRSWSMVKMAAGHKARKLFFNLRSTRNRLERQGPQEDPVQSLATELGVTTAEVNEMEVRLAARDYSLDRQVSDSTPTTFVEQLADGVATPEDALAEKQEDALQRRQVASALKHLSEREADVIYARYLGDDSLTLQELGDKMRVSRERVRQIESRALGKIRAALSGISA